MRPRTISVLLFVLLTTLLCFSQQEWVSRYDAFAGYSYLSTPKYGLFENGFNGEFGVNMRSWVALGIDYSIFTGNTKLVPNQLSTSLQQTLLPYILAIQKVDPSYRFVAPYDATTWTISGGPQINIRKLKAVTFFVRPALGAFHQTVTVKPGDPYTKSLLQGLAQQGIISSSFKKDETVLFYGFGGGMDFNVSRHFGLRTAADFVHYDLFSGVLAGAPNTVRFSVGPTFRFGPNIVK